MSPPSRQSGRRGGARGRREKRTPAAHPRPSGGRAVLEERIAVLLGVPEARALTFGEIAAGLGLGGKARARLRETLLGLERAGKLERTRHRWQPAPPPPSLSGVLEVNPRGFGFLRADEGGADIYIPAEGMGGALHRDRVEVELEDAGGWLGSKARGRVVGILERGAREIVGTVIREGAGRRFLPDNPAYIVPIRLPPGGKGGAGEKVSVRLVPGDSSGGLRGEVVEVLGSVSDPAVDTLGVIRGAGLPERHGSHALAEAGRLPREISPSDLAGREDLRGLDVFTVDPPDAADFDDAVSLERDGAGNCVLGVHISDVSHYVLPDSALDREARERGTSVYFPARVLHMLPPILATGICSLQEGADRLALSVFLTYDPAGRLLGRRFAPSVIRSRRRFTYPEVARIIERRLGAEREKAAPLAATLDAMADLARLLKTARAARGALDLDLPEEKVVFDPAGRIEAIYLERSDVSHSLIEEFMIAANEAAAGFLARRRAPLVYRVHEPPDGRSLREFSEFARGLGLSPGRLSDRRRFQVFLDSVRSLPLGYVIQAAFLRSLRPAAYSAVNTGHFGLASGEYAYFTSPIRRYPDLVTHRLLKAALAGTPFPALEGSGELARLCSQTERRGLEAEREMLLLRKLQFFRQGSERGENKFFPGVVVAVKKTGFFVHLNDYLISGFLPARSLPRGRRVRRGDFSLGDSVRVRIKKVDLRERLLELALETG